MALNEIERLVDTYLETDGCGLFQGVNLAFD
jgi:hypothetical protein